MGIRQCFADCRRQYFCPLPRKDRLRDTVGNGSNPVVSDGERILVFARMLGIFGVPKTVTSSDIIAVSLDRRVNVALLAIVQSSRLDRLNQVSQLAVENQTSAAAVDWFVCGH